MKGIVGIIGALEAEVNEILSIMENKQSSEAGGMVFHKGDLGGRCCVVAKCGAGKVNAAMCTQAMAVLYNPEAIINIGVAGGLADTKIGDAVVSTACVQYDYDTSLLDGPQCKNVLSVVNLKEIPSDKRIGDIIADSAEKIYGKVYRGIIATGDQFVADGEICKQIETEHNAYAVEMEGGAIAHVCYLNNIPCVVVRTISDNANDNASVDFPSFVASSGKRVQQLLSSVINLI